MRYETMMHSGRILLLAALALASCKSAAPEPALKAPGVSDKKQSDCTIVPRGCPGDASDNGCAATVVNLDENCSVSQQAAALMVSAAEEILNDRDLTRMRIVGPDLSCSNAFRNFLEEQGVPGWRLTIAAAPNRTFITFETEAWKERDCRTGEAVKPPPTSRAY
jgi:hypothetical protein